LSPETFSTVIAIFPALTLTFRILKPAIVLLVLEQSKETNTADAVVALQIKLGSLMVNVIKVLFHHVPVQLNVEKNFPIALVAGLFKKAKFDYWGEAPAPLDSSI